MVDPENQKSPFGGRKKIISKGFGAPKKKIPEGVGWPQEKSTGKELMNTKKILDSGDKLAVGGPKDYCIGCAKLGVKNF